MLESFEDSPNNYGILTLSEQEMNETVSTAAEMGLNIAIHAIGDRAAHVALNSIEKAQQYLTGNSATSRDLSGLRYRVEHVQLITPEDLERMHRLGVVASVQPFHAVADRDIAERYWGKRHRRAYAYRTMQQMGIPLALGSDAPVETFDPLRILYAATTRRDNATPRRPPWLPDQALPIAEALWGYTLGAAYAGSEEKRKEPVMKDIAKGGEGDIAMMYHALAGVLGKAGRKRPVRPEETELPGIDNGGAGVLALHRCRPVIRLALRQHLVPARTHPQRSLRKRTRAGIMANSVVGRARLLPSLVHGSAGASPSLGAECS